MMRSLYSGVSGLQNHQTKMDVIGNNISNVNTTGFKKGRVNFHDMLSQNINGASRPEENKGGINPKQVGLGMSIASIDTVFTQGSAQTTGNKFDLAIQGEGFFVLKDGDKEYYTRAGVFGTDQNGTLVNPGTGLKVQGWMEQQIDGESIIRTSDTPGDIVIPMFSKDPAKATQNVDFKCNLFSEMAAVEGGFEAFDQLPVSQQMKNSWTSSIDIFDNFGNPLEARFTFIKTDTNEWQVRSEIYRQDPANPNGEKIRLDNDQYSLNVNPNAEGAEGTAAEMGQNIFTLNFDNLGQIRTVTDQAGDVMDAGALYVTLNMNIPAAEGELENNQMALNLNLGEAGRVKTEEGVGVTQFGSDFSTKPFRQDGFAMGYLEDVKVDSSGSITGVFSNGNNRTLAQIALATFANNGGLEKAGETNFQASNNSGIADISAAGTVGKGKIIAGALEMSNVDLAEQFTEMITTQRGFQANSKTITTSDQMLQELLTLKR